MLLMEAFWAKIHSQEGKHHCRPLWLAPRHGMVSYCNYYNWRSGDWLQTAPLARYFGHAPLILYSSVSCDLVVEMLRTEVDLEPTVSTRSNPGASTGWTFSSLMVVPERRAKGLRIGMVGRRLCSCV
jgi:hypothetical protein